MPAVLHTCPRNFPGVGGGPVGTEVCFYRSCKGIGADTRPHRRAGVASRRNSALFPAVFLPVLPLFTHGFPAVARVAQALQVTLVDEQRPVALVVLDVVHVGGPDPPALTGTFPAEWLPQELGRPKLVRPDRQVVPAVPGRALPAGRRLGLVSRAPALPGQRGAAWVPAGPQRFARRGLSPPDKTKTPEPRSNRLAGHGLRRSTLWPLSIFRTISRLQSRQYTGRSRACVSGSTRSRRRLRLQTGQVTHPSFTISLPHCGAVCNLSMEVLLIITENILTPKTEKNRKAILFFVFFASIWAGGGRRHRAAGI